MSRRFGKKRDPEDDNVLVMFIILALIVLPATGAAHLLSTLTTE